MPQGKISFEFCKCKITWDIKSKGEKKDVSPHLRKSRICNSGNFCFWNLEYSTFYCGIRNPGLWNHEYRLRKLESHLAIGIWNLNSTDKESRTEYLESRIHGVESRNQE